MLDSPSGRSAAGAGVGATTTPRSKRSPRLTPRGSFAPASAGSDAGLVDVLRTALKAAQTQVTQLRAQLKQEDEGSTTALAVLADELATKAARVEALEASAEKLRTRAQRAEAEARGVIERHGSSSEGLRRELAAAKEEVQAMRQRVAELETSEATYAGLVDKLEQQSLENESHMTELSAALEVREMEDGAQSIMVLHAADFVPPPPTSVVDTGGDCRCRA